MNKPERGNGPLRQTDRQMERGKKLGKGLDAAKDRAGGSAGYLPTWGCRRRKLSVGLGVASMWVTGWLRA